MGLGWAGSGGYLSHYLVLAQRGTMDSAAPSPSRRYASVTSYDACQYELTLNETSQNKCFHVILKGAIVQDESTIGCAGYVVFRRQTFLPSAGCLKSMYCV